MPPGSSVSRVSNVERDSPSCLVAVERDRRTSLAEGEQLSLVKPPEREGEGEFVVSNFDPGPVGHRCHPRPRRIPSLNAYANPAHERAAAGPALRKVDLTLSG